MGALAEEPGARQQAPNLTACNSSLLWFCPAHRGIQGRLQIGTVVGSSHRQHCPHCAVSRSISPGHVTAPSTEQGEQEAFHSYVTCVWTPGVRLTLAEGIPLDLHPVFRDELSTSRFTALPVHLVLQFRPDKPRRSLLTSSLACCPFLLTSTFLA